ncbi:MAG: chromate transporter [Clostridia bacterium]|nr:chromate transporter [Clostridia bacterium]
MFTLESIKIYKEIFIAFLKPGLFTFGGGPSAIPLIQEEVVEHYGWLTVQEFADALALGNSLPGPIATKMAALIGYRTAGWLGALVGIIAIVAPTALAIIFLIKIYMNFKDSQWLKGMMTAVRPVVVILIAQVIISLSKNSFIDYRSGIIALIAAVGLFKFNLHPVILIVAALTYGGFFIR